MHSNHYPLILITNLCSIHTPANKACLRATHRQAMYAPSFQPSCWSLSTTFKSVSVTSFILDMIEIHLR